MLTLQEIQSKSFEKAVFGGYDMKGVDEFLERVTEDYSVLQKENATLKAKMKVLIEKIEEYRTVEDGMRKALLSAQNIADEMISKAKNESQQLVANAEKAAKDELAKIAGEIASEEIRFEEAKAKTKSFAMKITEFYQNEINGILRLSSALGLEENAILQPPAPPSAVKNPLEFSIRLPFVEEEVAKVAKVAEAKPDMERTREIDPILEPAVSSEDVDILSDSRGSGLNMKVIEVAVPSGGRPAAHKSPEEGGYERRRLEFNTSELKFGSDYLSDDDI